MPLLNAANATGPNDASPFFRGLRVWLDPRDGVTASGGVVVSAPNRAPGGGVLVFPGAGGAGTTPLYSATRFNGSKPGFGWDGITERRLQTLIPGSFNDSCTFIAAVNSFNGAFDGNLGFSNIFETARDLTDIVSGFDVGPGDLPPVAWDLERYDDTGTNTDASPDQQAPGYPCVYTGIVNFGGQNIQRFNGKQAIAKTVSHGYLSPQKLVVVGGNSNANDTAFGNLISQFELGTLLMFDGALPPTALSFWEHFVGQVSGITF